MIAERLTALVGQHGRSSKASGAPYGTDGAAFSAVGVPTVVFGPGSIDQAHTADEFITVSELELAVEIFYDIACHGMRLRCLRIAATLRVAGPAVRSTAAFSRKGCAR